MASRSLRIKASKHWDDFAELVEVDGRFRKRDVDILAESESLWRYLLSEGALKQVDEDDDAGVCIWTWSYHVSEWLDDEFDATDA